MFFLRASTRRAAAAMKGALISKGVCQFFRLARSAEHVLDADKFDGAGHCRRQGFRHRAAQPAIDIVILGGDDGAGFPGAARHQIGVHGFDGGHVDHPRRDAVFRQRVGGVEGARHFRAAGDDGDVLAIAQDLALADLESVIVAEQARSRGCVPCAYRPGRRIPGSPASPAPFRWDRPARSRSCREWRGTPPDPPAPGPNRHRARHRGRDGWPRSWRCAAHNTATAAPARWRAGRKRRRW